MKERYLLIDFENIQTVNLSRLADDLHVTVFVGSSQKAIPFDLVQGVQGLGARVEWVKVEGNGSNALDFYIAYHLGCRFTQSQKAQCFVLSRDTGFDPLVRYLTGKGFRCQRISSLAELEPSCGDTAESGYQRLVECLAKAEKNRPRTRAKLANHVSAMFHKKLPDREVKRLIDLLFKEGKVTETDSVLSYSF